MGRISTSSRYMIEIIGTDLLSLGELEGETGNLGKRENRGIFFSQMGYQILMKLDI